MLTIAHERQSHYSDISNSTKGVIFFGTPHCGAAVAKMTRILRDVLNVCTIGSVRVDLLKDLETKSEALVELAEQFVERANNLKIITVYEGRPVLSASLPLVRPFEPHCTYVAQCLQIVDRSSATLGLPNERVIPVDADHRHICKFSDGGDARYQHVLDAVATLIRDIVTLESMQIWNAFILYNADRSRR